MEYPDSSFVKSIFNNLTVDSRDQCRIRCFMDTRCKSYNIGPSQGDAEKHVCELSSISHLFHQDHLVSRPGFSYYPAKVSLCQPCPFAFPSRLGLGSSFPWERNLVPRVLRLSGQWSVARRDSRELKFYFNFLNGCLVTACIVSPQKSCGNEFQFSPGYQQLVKEPEDSGYEIGGGVI